MSSVVSSREFYEGKSCVKLFLCYVSMYILLTPPAEYASDHKYRFLLNFLEWVEKTTYYPLPSVPRVSCSVQVEVGQEAIDVGGVECDRCAPLLQNSDLLRVVKAFNWNVIEVLDTSMTVSCTKIFVSIV